MSVVHVCKNVDCVWKEREVDTSLPTSKDLRSLNKITERYVGQRSAPVVSGSGRKRYRVMEID